MKVAIGVRLKGWSNLDNASPDIEVRRGDTGMIVDFFDGFVQILWENRTGWFQTHLLRGKYISHLLT